MTFKRELQLVQSPIPLKIVRRIAKYDRETRVKRAVSHVQLSGLGSIPLIATTFVLFPLALSISGPTRDISLETGFLLLSVALIVAGYKSSVLLDTIRSEPAEFEDLLKPDVRVT